MHENSVKLTQQALQTCLPETQVVPELDIFSRVNFGQVFTDIETLFSDTTKHQFNRWPLPFSVNRMNNSFLLCYSNFSETHNVFSTLCKTPFFTLTVNTRLLEMQRCLHLQHLLPVLRSVQQTVQSYISMTGPPACLRKYTMERKKEIAYMFWTNIFGILLFSLIMKDQNCLKYQRKTTAEMPMFL